MNYPNQNGNDSFFDLIGVLSFYVSLLNLDENRQQSAHNDVQAANDKQAQYLLNEINRRFDEQNQILADQNVMLDRLLELLEEKQ